MTNEKQSFLTDAALEAVEILKGARQDLDKMATIPFMKRKAPPLKAPAQTGGIQ